MTVKTGRDGSRFFTVYWRDGIDGKDRTGRDGKTVVKIEPWSRPVPSGRQFSPTVNSYRPVPLRKFLPLHFIVPSRRGNFPLPSRPVDKTCPYHPVPSTKCILPCRPVVKTCPYRTAPPSKPVLSLRSRPAIHSRHSFPSRCRDHQDAVNTMNSYSSINSTNT